MTFAPSKGPLMRCTVPRSTPNCLAMTRTPAARGRESLTDSLFERRNKEAAYPHSWPAQGRPDPFCDHRSPPSRPAHHASLRVMARLSSMPPKRCAVVLSGSRQAVSGGLKRSWPTRTPDRQVPNG
jgi:hypothetical protein